MKRKITILAFCFVAVAALTAVYTAGWLNGQTGQGSVLVKEAQAAGGVVKDGKFGTSDVDGPWLKKFMKKHGLTEDDLKAGQ